MYVIKDEMDHINVRKLQKLYRYFAIRSDPGLDLGPNDFYGSGSVFDLGKQLRIRPDPEPDPLRSKNWEH